jgi:hypothetical protein
LLSQTGLHSFTLSQMGLLSFTVVLSQLTLSGQAYQSWTALCYIYDKSTKTQFKPSTYSHDYLDNFTVAPSKLTRTDVITPI